MAPNRRSLDAEARPVERHLTDLELRWRDAKLAHRRGVLLAKREKIDAELRPLGLHMDPAKALSIDPATGEKRSGLVGVHGFRDQRGRILSAEHDFVSVASAFLGASDQEIAEAMKPSLRTAEERFVTAACAAVRKKRQELHERRIVVRYDCDPSTCKRCLLDRKRAAERAAENERDPIVAIVNGHTFRRSQWANPDAALAAVKSQS